MSESCLAPAFRTLTHGSSGASRDTSLRRTHRDTRILPEVASERTTIGTQSRPPHPQRYAALQETGQQARRPRGYFVNACFAANGLGNGVDRLAGRPESAYPLLGGAALPAK